MATPTAYPSASLYVGDLHKDVTEAFLYEIFKEAGSIISIRICRDVLTRESLGYAYVNFQNAADAERAMQSLNYTVINDKPIRIMWSMRDPTIRKSGVGNVFIKNLDREIDNKALYDTFHAFGGILSCKVQHRPGRDTGVGYVHFREKSSADQAIAKLNGMLMNGRKVTVEHYSRKNKRRVDDSNFTNCYIKNISKEISDEGLATLFGQFGEVQNAAVMKVRQTDESRGFGFCNFLEHESAVAAVDRLNGLEDPAVAAAGKSVYCARSMSRAERQQFLREKYQRDPQSMMRFKNPGTNLYVKHLDETVTDEELRALFVEYGDITSAKVMKDDATQLSKGFGFVNFTTSEEATRAITEMNDKLVGSKPLYVALAQPKAVRRQQLLQRFSRRVGGQPQQGQYPQMGMPYYGQMGMRGAPPHMMAAYAQQGPHGHPGMRQPPPDQRGARGGHPPGGWGPPPGAMPPGHRGGYPDGQETGFQFKQGSRNVDKHRAQLQERAYAGQPAGIPPEMHQMMQPMPPGAMPPGGMPPGAMPPGAMPPGAMDPRMAAEMAAEMAGMQDVPPAHDQQKQVFGEQLFPLVMKMVGGRSDQAGKITGMLLEMDPASLSVLVQDPEALSQRVTEANRYMADHEQHAALVQQQQMAAQQAAMQQQQLQQPQPPEGQ